MWIVRVRDRGRDLSVHKVDRADEAAEVRRVYEVLGYAPDKIIVEPEQQEQRAA